MLLSNQIATKILAIVSLVVLVLFLIAYLIVNKIYKGMFGRRFDKTFLHFFTHEDFEGLKFEPIEFKTNNDNTLKGNIYYYEKEEYNYGSLSSIGYDWMSLVLTKTFSTKVPNRNRGRFHDRRILQR